MTSGTLITIAGPVRAGGSAAPARTRGRRFPHRTIGMA